MTSSYSRSIGAIVGSAVLSLTASVASAYPTVVTQGMTILKSGVQAGYVIFAAPDGTAYAVECNKARWSRSGGRRSRIPTWVTQDRYRTAISSAAFRKEKQTARSPKLAARTFSR